MPLPKLKAKVAIRSAIHGAEPMNQQVPCFLRSFEGTYDPNDLLLMSGKKAVDFDNLTNLSDSLLNAMR